MNKISKILYFILIIEIITVSVVIFLQTRLPAKERTPLLTSTSSQYNQYNTQITTSTNLGNIVKSGKTELELFEELQKTSKNEEEFYRGLEERKVPFSLDFLKEKVDISNWNVYRNEEYGFEIKYPPYYYSVNEERVQRITQELKKAREKEVILDGLVLLFLRLEKELYLK